MFALLNATIVSGWKADSELHYVMGQRGSAFKQITVAMITTVIIISYVLFKSEALHQLSYHCRQSSLHLYFIQQVWERSTRQHVKETGNLQVTRKNDAY